VTRFILAGIVLSLFACGDNLEGPIDAAPCTTPAGGACVGNSLHYCVGDVQHEMDCEFATCQADGDGFACVDPCDEAGVTENGTCTGEGFTRCGFDDDGRHFVETVSCPIGQTCNEVENQPVECAGDPCAGIGPLGRCEGDNLVQCTNGQPATTNCATNGMTCGFGTNAYACIATPAGAFVVSGKIEYEDRPPNTDGSLGDITTQAVRSAEVAVVLDSNSNVLATAHTSDDGSYKLFYTTTAGTMVHIMVTARSTVPQRLMRVNRTQNTTHAFGGTAFAAAATSTQNVLVTEASGLAEAFNILDMGVIAFDVIRLQMGGTPMQLTARWSVGSNNGTYYTNGGIFLLGAASDDDGYDDTVILHEIGHFVEDFYGRTDSPGGSHDGSPTDPNLGWSEGCSTYFAMAARGRPFYMDSNSGGGWGYDAEETVTDLAAPSMLTSDISEDTVTEILWDIADGGGADDDPLTTENHTKVLLIWPDYLRTATLRNVAETGVDLVDFLDGWFIEQGLSSCAGVKNIVNTTHNFPYDYGSSAGPCP
jgi:hypothetical protein